MNINNALVSIVIPCYNDKDYIEEAVNSALIQTYPNIEIIIVDDGSNIVTKRVLQSVKNDKIKLIEQENKGLSAARNMGISISKGDFILTHDADDIFDPFFIEKALSVLLKNEKVGVVTCGCNYFIKKNQVVHRHMPTGGKLNNFLFKNNALGNSLFRKRCWEEAGGFDEKMKHGYEDWEFWISVTKNDWEVFVINEFLFNYRKKENSMLHITNKYYDLENYSYVLKKHNKLYSENFGLVVDFLLNNALKYKINEEKRINSLDYRIGNKILYPFRILKKYIKYFVN